MPEPTIASDTRVRKPSFTHELFVFNKVRVNLQRDHRIARASSNVAVAFSSLSELDLRDESRSSDSYYPANGVDQNHWDERNESIEPEKVSPDTSGSGK
jgi:hypothetical protein